MFEAASRFGGRLPELFCGFDRERYPEPVVVPGVVLAAGVGRRDAASRCCAPRCASTRRCRPATCGSRPTSSEDFGDIHLRNVPFAGSRISVDAVARRRTRSPACPAGLTLHHDAAPRTGDGAHPKGPVMRIGIIAPPWIPIPPTAYGGIESFIDTLARALARCRARRGARGIRRQHLPGADGCPGFEPSDPATMGVTAHELRHLLRAFEGLADVDVIVDNTLGGPDPRPASRPGVPVVTVAHGPLIPLEQELYVAAAAEMSRSSRSRTTRRRSRGQCRSPGSSTTASGSRTCRSAPAATRPASSAGCIRRRACPRRSRPRRSPASRCGSPRRCRSRPSRSTSRRSCARRSARTPSTSASSSTDEKYELMGSSCALLNPIQWDEPFGLVMIEAMATGTPVVATPRGSVREIVEEGRTGFIRVDARGPRGRRSRASLELDRGACRTAVETRFTVTADGRGLHRALRGHAAARASRPRRGGRGQRTRRRRATESAATDGRRGRVAGEP